MSDLMDRRRHGETMDPNLPPPAPTQVGENGDAYAAGTTMVRETTPAIVADPGDRVRWGPIWAGVTVVIALFALLQLALFATDAVSLDINPTSSGNSFTLWSVLAAIVAFLVGGMVAGATAKWRNLTDGLIQGIVMWAVATIALLLASSIAFGNLTSSLGGVLGRLADLRTTLSTGGSANAGTVSDARDLAAQACLFLGLTVLASSLGALMGAKLWPRRTTTNTRRTV